MYMGMKPGMGPMGPGVSFGNKSSFCFTFSNNEVKKRTPQSLNGFYLTIFFFF